jgi:hypothetical protein
MRAGVVLTHAKTRACDRIEADRRMDAAIALAYMLRRKTWAP